MNIYDNAEPWKFNDNDILDLLPSYEKELINNSNNSLEQRLVWKNFYKRIKKNLFSWNGYWSDRNLFFENMDKDMLNNEIKNNDIIVNKDNISNIKYKIMNHYTKSFMKPLLIPILDMSYYLPNFTGFKKDDLFYNNPKFIVNMDIDKNTKLTDDLIKRRETKIISKENYLRKIYIK